MGQMWELEDLRALVERLAAEKLESEGSRIRFCFFVDGLDEYDGDHSNIIHILRQLSKSEDVKICASSRPWNVFQNAFGEDKSGLLVLQDLTHDDIALYVREKLEEDPRFVELLQEDHRCEGLIEEVTEKANGVFLWVTLVVKQLLKSLENADGVHDLQRRLSELPPDLEEYFQHMFDNIDEFYKQQTARMFQVCVHSEWPLAVLAYAVLDAEDPLASRMVSSEAAVDHRDISHLVSRLTKRINGRCQDLLEVSLAPDDLPTVDFLHRTVKDFLVTRDMNSMLVGRTGEDFDVHLTLCQMHLVEVRRLEAPFRVGCTKVQHLVSYARLMEQDQKRTPYEELGQLEVILGASTEDTAFFTLRALVPYQAEQNPFIPLMVLSGLTIYLRKRLQSDRSLMKVPHKPSLLRVALEELSEAYESTTLLVHTSRIHDARTKVISPEIVSLLLEFGDDPNARGVARSAKTQHQSTVWTSFLGNLGSSSVQWEAGSPSPTRSMLLSTTEALITGGAEYGSRIIVRRGHESYYQSEIEVLTYAFGQDDAERLQRLRSSSSRSARMLSSVTTSLGNFFIAERWFG